MIGSSVVPGLPNRWVTPSSFSSARNAERPVILFFIVPPARRFVGRAGWRQMTKLGGRRQWSGGYSCPAATFSYPGSAVQYHSSSKTHVNVLVVPHCVRGARAVLDHSLTLRALLL